MAKHVAVLMGGFSAEREVSLASGKPCAEALETKGYRVTKIDGVPYTHSGVLASAMAMQKDLAKVVMRAAGIPVPGGKIVSRREAAKSHVLERPYVLKPVNEGSSVGVFIVKE